MTEIGLPDRIGAGPEHAGEVDTMLRDAPEFARAEEGAVTWFSFRGYATVFGVLDSFADETGRTHLQGRIAAALKEATGTTLASPPGIRRVGVLAAGLL
ncbi:antibiotic biosynthesis monooxygenase [Streptomyces sp. NPDC088354]|uniref:antibiotic biosynthesis monooxygenase n=1 Tax=unclassified Streptomyces TaxID=2593676 RepID=UPI0029BC0C6F|nr:antibiotic biosynthesis monooxygenase [Streptomyces sp. MI02-7b]MDX3073843.1 antibiotic biosynthesis monooxygenase [Streptomyces sp. MI02-7b]